LNAVTKHRATASSSHPIGFPGWCHATTSPTAAIVAMVSSTPLSGTTVPLVTCPFSTPTSTIVLNSATISAAWRAGSGAGR